jgi:signal transduction histidine kinase
MPSESKPDATGPAGPSYADLARVVGGLAHEIKNPLSTINLNLRLLSEDLGQYRDEEHRRLQRRLDHVMDEATRLREILNDFLRFAGKHELQCTEVDLRDLIEELHDFFIAQAESSHVVMRQALPDQPVPARVDVNLLKQCILNLLINAVQAMEETSGGELMVRLTGQPDRAEIHVTDTGPGIDAEKIGRIFDPYFSTKSDGSGLGLATAHRIIQEHGGEMTVESEPGKGTDFTITLPGQTGAECCTSTPD